MGESRGFQCQICYTCQVCVMCEKYTEVRGQIPPQQIPPQQRMPMPMTTSQPQPTPTMLLTEDDIRRIVKEAMLEVLIQLGLVKPQERKRELK